jgi:hypothetical protein
MKLLKAAKEALATDAGAAFFSGENWAKTRKANSTRNRPVSQAAMGDAQKVVDRGFRLGLVLSVVLLTGAVLAGPVYRFFAEKLKRSGPSPSASAP